jgi:EpsI family protein
MTVRIIVVSVCMVAVAAYLTDVSQSERVLPRESLAAFPRTFSQWSGRDTPPLTADVLAVLGVDDYIDRVYSGAGSGEVALYVGYYRSQREGDTIHSPLNCLPGAGWQPVTKAYVSIPVQNATTSNIAPITVNKIVVEKGIDRQLVLYWYQGRGRAVASEYSSKLFTAYDAIRLNRTDGALVRVVSPIPIDGANSEIVSGRRAEEFVKAVYPLLGRYLPS